MPLPPLLLERLKRRKIIQDVVTLPTENREPVQPRLNKIDSLEARYVDSASNEVVGTSISEQEQEEIIAEDYSDDEEPQDDDDKSETRSDVTNTAGEDKITDNDGEETVNPDGSDEEAGGQETQVKQVESVLGCPNKYNIYHNCSKYCADRHSEPENVEPTMQQRKDLAMILRIYPMSNEWTVVFDPGVRTFYFWNIISNLVSWLPPEMNGFVSLSADQIRKSMREMDHHKYEQDTPEL